MGIEGVAVPERIQITKSKLPFLVDDFGGNAARVGDPPAVGGRRVKGGSVPGFAEAQDAVVLSVVFLGVAEGGGPCAAVPVVFDVGAAKGVAGEGVGVSAAAVVLVGAGACVAGFDFGFWFAVVEIGVCVAGGGIPLGGGVVPMGFVHVGGGVGVVGGFLLWVNLSGGGAAQEEEEKGGADGFGAAGHVVFASGVQYTKWKDGVVG